MKFILETICYLFKYCSNEQNCKPKIFNNKDDIYPFRNIYQINRETGFYKMIGVNETENKINDDDNDIDDEIYGSEIDC